MKKIFNITSLSIVIILMVALLSIGYSAFNRKMYISDLSLNVQLKRDIQVTEFSVGSGTNGAISSYEEYKYNSVSSGVTLPNENSTMTYRVNVTNFGNVEMGIYDLLNLPDNLTYEIDGYQLKDKICDSTGKCSLGITKEFMITIRYKDGMYDASNTTYNINLKFDFRRMNRITYQNMTVSNYPTEVIDGGRLEVTFLVDIPAALIAYVDGTVTDAYSYRNHTFVMESVFGDVTIEKVNVDFGIVDGNTEYVVDQITPSGNTMLSDFLNMSFEGRNSSGLIITQLDVVISFQANTGSTQTINVLLKIGNNPALTQEASLNKQSTVTTVSFTNLNMIDGTPFVISTSPGNLNNRNIKINQLKIVIHF